METFSEALGEAERVSEGSILGKLDISFPAFASEQPEWWEEP